MNGAFFDPFQPNSDPSNGSVVDNDDGSFEVIVQDDTSDRSSEDWLRTTLRPPRPQEFHRDIFYDLCRRLALNDPAIQTFGGIDRRSMIDKFIKYDNEREVCRDPALSHQR